MEILRILRILWILTSSDKILRDKAFNIAKTLKYDGYPKVIASVINF